MLRLRKLGCWKWFNKVLDAAGIKVTEENREKVDEVIHQYIGEQSRYGRYSADWRKARKEIQTDKAMRQELIDKLQSIV
jgi:predicted Fe-Mo cluster-binding NifX family protein